MARACRGRQARGTKLLKRYNIFARSWPGLPPRLRRPSELGARRSLGGDGSRPSTLFVRRQGRRGRPRHLARRRAEPVIGPRYARTRWRFCAGMTTCGGVLACPLPPSRHTNRPETGSAARLHHCRSQVGPDRRWLDRSWLRLLPGVLAIDPNRRGDKFREMAPRFAGSEQEFRVPCGASQKKRRCNSS